MLGLDAPPADIFVLKSSGQFDEPHKPFSLVLSIGYVEPRDDFVEVAAQSMMLAIHSVCLLRAMPRENVGCLGG